MQRKAEALHANDDDHIVDTNTIINANIISKNNSNNNNNNNSTDDDDTIAADASIVAKLEYVASYSKVSLHESLSALYQWSLIEVTPSIPQHINNNSSSSSSNSRGGDDKMLIFFQSKAIDIIFTTIINDDTLPLTANSVIREVFKSLLVNVLSFEHSPTQKPIGFIVNRFVFTYVV